MSRRVVRPRRPAADRARVARAVTGLTTAAAAGALLAVGSHPTAAPVAAAATAGLFAAHSRQRDLEALAAIGPVPAATLARPASVLPARAEVGWLLRRLASTPDVTHHVVAGDGWALLSRRRLLDQALTVGVAATVELGRIGMPVAVVAPTMPVDRLPHLPTDDRPFVIDASAGPLLLSRTAVLHPAAMTRMTGRWAPPVLT